MWPSSLLKRFFPSPKHIPHTRALSSTQLDPWVEPLWIWRFWQLLVLKHSILWSLVSLTPWPLISISMQGIHQILTRFPKLRQLWACVVCFLFPGDLYSILLWSPVSYTSLVHTCVCFVFVWRVIVVPVIPSGTEMNGFHQNFITISLSILK